MAIREHLDFSLSLHRRLVPAADRSFCWSPYSVAAALGSAATFAGGSTRDELVAALRIAEDDLAGPLKLLSAAAELGDKGPALEAPVLAVVDTLWVHETLPLHREALRALSTWLGGTLRNAPFLSAPEQARQLINSDVAETTRELIPELLAPGAIDSETVAALVTALYLKTSWHVPFERNATVAKPFHTPHGTRDVPMMHATRRFGYAAVEGWQVVSLTAAGGVEAVVLLPDAELAPSESRLDDRSLHNLLSAISQRRVELFMPRFEVTGDADLRPSLESLGVGSLFTSEADFSPLSEYPLRVSAAVHQAVLRVDESGLEGAAATAMAMQRTAFVREPPPIRVEVDRPFLFLVRHRDSGAIYFLARVVDPS